MRAWTATFLLAACIPTADAEAQPEISCELSATVRVCSAAGSPRAQLQAATFIAGSEATGATFGQAVSLEVATAPLGSSSGGFVYTFEPATRGFRRTSATFGPAFAERALTIGRGKFSSGLNFLHRSYDTFGGVDLDRFDVFRFVGGELAVRTSELQLEAKTDTIAFFGHYGVLDNLDVGVLVPYVKLTLDGAARMFTDEGGEVQRLALRSSTAGIGDVALFTKYRFMRFGPAPAAGAGTNGALAIAATVTLPTGSEEELRGLGVGRAQVSLIGSATMGRFSPHANVGYELWTSAVEVPRDFQGGANRSTKDQVHYVAGGELEVTRTFTLMGEVLGRYLRGTGQVDYQPYQFRQNRSQVQGATALVAAPNGVHSVYLVPGVKWNFYGDGLLNIHALVPVTREGLRDRFTPVIGIDWGF